MVLQSFFQKSKFWKFRRHFFLRGSLVGLFHFFKTQSKNWQENISSAEPKI
jgi:hypothetical protein